MRKFVLSRKERRKHLMVSEDIHILVCVYAKDKGITLAEATYILLGKGLALEFGLSKEEIASIRPVE